MSRRLNALRKQITVLRTQLLPEPFDPLGQYPNASRVQTSTRGFLVLSHAEVESFVEGWAKDIARSAERVWSSSGRISPPLSFLLATSEQRLEPAESLANADGDSHSRLGRLVTAVFTKHYRLINNNHGIKEKNMLALFDPVGIPESAFGPSLLPELNTLGSMRGKHAHYSAATVESVLDPETEFNRLTRVVTELAVLDTYLFNYKRRIR